MQHQACYAIPAVALALAGSSASAQISDPREQISPAPADLILQNGDIYTPDGWATALAVSDGAIVAVGGQDAVEPHRTDATRVVDLAGATVLPGLHDMHVHPMGAGASALACVIPQGSPPDEILAVVAQCAEDAEPGEWITGRAWQADSFGDTPPHRSMLDEAAPENPAIFTDISGHSSWANSLALEAAGITAETPDPPNGIIERDADGEPTGILRESASGMVSGLVPPPSREQNEQALAWALDVMLSEGITSFEDAGIGEAGLIAYASLADQGVLKQRVRGCLWGGGEEILSKRMYYARDRFDPSCVKLVLDGVPTDGHTAAMVDPYEPIQGHLDSEGRETGILMIDPGALAEQVTRLDDIGMTVKFHAAGDAAVRAALDAIEAAREANGFTGLLHNSGHNSFIKMEDIQRARDLGATFEFSPYIWYSSPITQDIRRAVGEERMERWIPIKDALDAGALSVPASDWPVVPNVNPWIAIESMVTRRPPGGEGEPLGAQEAITLEQAIDMFTIDSARQMYRSHATGSIERGKLADLVVIDRNIFEVPVTTIHETKVLRTFIDGEEVYTAEGL